MGFKRIPVDRYVQMHLRNNPSEDETDLRKRLASALAAYEKGIKCACGNDIWVIGSAFAGPHCYSCITGEASPVDDYEIDTAINKGRAKAGRRHIDDKDPTQIFGFFTDDGYEVNVDLIPKPSLCLSCVHNDDPHEELLCNLNRMDQRDEKDFVCFAYRKANP